MNPHLFVYGTLMSHTESEMARRLGREAVSLGPATIQGVLFRISWYPGLVEGDGRVHGEVFRLSDPASSLAWLDAYEGIVPADPAGHRGEYERVERTVLLESGGSLTSWVYLYCADVSRAEVMPEGRWR